MTSSRNSGFSSMFTSFPWQSIEISFGKIDLESKFFGVLVSYLASMAAFAPTLITALGGFTVLVLGLVAGSQSCFLAGIGCLLRFDRLLAGFGAKDDVHPLYVVWAVSFFSVHLGAVEEIDLSPFLQTHILKCEIRNSAIPIPVSELVYAYT